MSQQKPNLPNSDKPEIRSAKTLHQAYLEAVNENQQLKSSLEALDQALKTHLPWTRQNTEALEAERDHVKGMLQLATSGLCEVVLSETITEAASVANLSLDALDRLQDALFGPDRQHRASLTWELELRMDDQLKDEVVWVCRFCQKQVDEAPQDDCDCCRTLPTGSEATQKPAAQYKVGDWVRKVTGEYHISGEVRSVFTKADGAVRLVVEHNAEGGGSFLRIYSEANLALDAPTAPTPVPAE